MDPLQALRKSVDALQLVEHLASVLVDALERLFDVLFNLEAEVASVSPFDSNCVLQCFDLVVELALDSANLGLSLLEDYLARVSDINNPLVEWVQLLLKLFDSDFEGIVPREETLVAEAFQSRLDLFEAWMHELEYFIFVEMLHF